MKRATYILLVALPAIVLLAGIIFFITSTRNIEYASVKRVEDQIEQVNQSIAIELVEEIQDPSELQKHIIGIQKELIILDTMLNEATYNVDKRVNYLGRSYDFSFISDSLSGRFSGDIQFNPFWEDGLSAGEYEFLKSLEVSLDAILARLEEGRDATVLGQALNDFFMNWNMYGEANQNGSSPYDNLIE